MYSRTWDQEYKLLPNLINYTMKKYPVMNIRPVWLIVFLTILTAYFLESCQGTEKLNNEPVTISNQSLEVSIDPSSGSFKVLERKSGQLWESDPWQNSAGLLSLKNSEGVEELVDISKGSTINIEQIDNLSVRLTFSDPIFADGKKAEGVKIISEIKLDPSEAELHITIAEYTSANYQLLKLRYPARQFSLETDKDRGAGVIPQWQGIICPSYIFPMTGGRFCQWDDAVYDERSIGSLKMYNFIGGLSMPWWGTYNEKSAVVGILNEDPAAEMFYNINNNGQYLFDSKGEMSPYKRILFLDPEWNLSSPGLQHSVTYCFIPEGDYVDMAKRYKQVAIERGYFKSLKEKQEKNKNVSKLPGAMYLGIYGGYPHYVNMEGMAFSFERLKSIIEDVHDDLGVDNAFIHAWGTFSNYVPNSWPISEELGGVEKLKEAVDLAKEYGYLYSSYHAYSPRLEHDPDFNLDLVPKITNGMSRWARVDSKYFLELCQKNLPKEIEAIGQNADVTDILFIGTPDSGRIALAEYLRSLDLVMGTERGQEHYIPYFDLFEGMTYFYCALEGVPLATISHKAPLFNLVYHDAIANYGKIQDPDNDITFNGDFRTKSLRNILFGNGTLLFFAPYEYEGMRPMVKISNELVSPIHRETFFDELLTHEYLSPDFQVQRSTFSGGTEVTVNLGPVDQHIENNKTIPAYGYIVKRKSGKIEQGQFEVSLSSLNRSN
ncbi:MAG: DUF5696 domain-containing protein [Bacteroidales bacterium]